jgi:hypothetical protein
LHAIGDRIVRLPFPSYGRVEAQRRSPRTLLFGENGSAKTTLLDAIGIRCAICPGDSRSDDEISVLAGAAAVALVGPTSQEAALRRLRPHLWLAVPAGAGLAWLLLLVGRRLPNVFIYFQL